MNENHNMMVFEYRWFRKLKLIFKEMILETALRIISPDLLCPYILYPEWENILPLAHILPNQMKISTVSIDNIIIFQQNLLMKPWLYTNPNSDIFSD